MRKPKFFNIVVLEPSDIIYEGLETLLVKTEPRFYFYRSAGLNELTALFSTTEINVVLINPIFVANTENLFYSLKNNFPKIKWIGLLYAFIDDKKKNIFDYTISITENISSIMGKIIPIEKHSPASEQEAVNLTEREIEILQQLTKGLSNKEIASRLNISTHTVISHRKNIVEKTGIKSLSGLTIYAISQNIISL